MAEIFVTRVEHFNAAHRLYNPSWSDDKNFEVFGKCANPNYHGHNYELHVCVKGNVQADTGYALNAKTLSDIIKKNVVDIADHRNLNIDVPFMTGTLTSAENFAIGIWQQLQPSITALGAQLYKITLIETKNIYVEYYGQ
jgi:6-pyruvoyltetrahydropterin/6-carboxytetrahydropterin synthase